mmetsp:Transcript_17989/g.49326  ORF Transcript_17989/g.49326 Transcript_17989/m.49326 type:complete len:419 (+) Transcript_17989:105-1361(+)
MGRGRCAGAAVVLACVGVALQGCGSPSPPEAETHTIVPTVAPTLAPTPLTRETAAADTLNQLYMGYDSADPTSPLGVVIHMLDSGSTDVNMGCGDCHDGYSTCKMRAQLSNHRMMTSSEHTVMPAFARTVGVVFKTEIADKALKCSYTSDGATDIRLNNGCGCSATSNKTGQEGCDDENSAFANLDPATGEEVTHSSLVVTDCHCSASTTTGCYFKGPAFFEGHGENELRDMVETRLADQQRNAIATEDWNELIFDTRVLQPNYSQDPASVILAILYVKSEDLQRTSIAYTAAKDTSIHVMRNRTGQAPPPIVALNVDTDVTKARPFEPPTSNALASITLSDMPVEVGAAWVPTTAGVTAATAGFSVLAAMVAGVCVLISRRARLTAETPSRAPHGVEMPFAGSSGSTHPGRDQETAA